MYSVAIVTQLWFEKQRCSTVSSLHTSLVVRQILPCSLEHLLYLRVKYGLHLRQILLTPGVSMLLHTSKVSFGLLAKAAFAFALTSGAANAHAQITQPIVPQISVQARGEIQVAPDRARVQVGVETQAKTAAIAAADNSKKQTAVLAAIRALGIPASAISTMNYSVSPVQRYDEKDRRVVLEGYRVSNIVQVETDKLEQAGSIIDAALNNGSNRIAGLDFLVKDAAKATDAALTQAVESARRQADVAARAAGGQITELLEVTVNDFERPQPRQVMTMAKIAAADSSPTPISEGTTTVTVSVSTRWRFEKK